MLKIFTSINKTFDYQKFNYLPIDLAFNFLFLLNLGHLLSTCAYTSLLIFFAASMI